MFLFYLTFFNFNKCSLFWKLRLATFVRRCTWAGGWTLSESFLAPSRASFSRFRSVCIVLVHDSNSVKHPLMFCPGWCGAAVQFVAYERQQMKKNRKETKVVWWREARTSKNLADGRHLGSCTVSRGLRSQPCSVARSHEKKRKQDDKKNWAICSLTINQYLHVMELIYF